jgi:hypothetical protein
VLVPQNDVSNALFGHFAVVIQVGVNILGVVMYLR